MKLLTFTRGADEMRPLLPELHRLYHQGEVEGMSIVEGPEKDLEGAVFIQRPYQEFSVEAVTGEADYVRAARRAVLEERPQRVLLAGEGPFYRELSEFCRTLGIEVWSGLGAGRQVRAAPAIARQPVAGEQDWLEAALDELALQPGRWAVAGLRPRDRPGFEWVEDGSVEGCRGVLGCLALSQASDPAALIAQHQGWPTLWLEPVNTPWVRGLRTFRYGDYDNEFALGPADLDLRSLLDEGWARVLCARSGAAGSARDLEAPDGRVPMLAVSNQGAAPHWLERFRLPPGSPLNIVLLDSQNIAGSVLNHSLAINRYTEHRATALCTTRHPFIEYPQEECRVIFVDQGLTPEVQAVLEAADALVFFEDDDETSPNWGFDLRPWVEGKPVVHVYIGYRVHRDVPRMQRPGRTVITPLPHLMRMFPEAHFYAGFPPASLDDMPLREPLSAQDGRIRVLHTPSLPHATLCRYYYHKDTETFLRAAGELQARLEQVEFWQLGGIPHQAILQARQDCDITFNQLRGYHGLAGDEAMYLERAMVQNFDQTNINRHREYWGMEVDFPWVTTDRAGLSRVLEALIVDGDRRRELARRSREFMLEYFCPRNGILPLIYYCRRARPVHII